MRGLIWFLPDYRDWPLAVVRELHERVPEASFCGIVTGTQNDHAYIARRALPAIEPLYFMDSLQRQWTSRSYESGRLSEYEAILGAQTLNRIIIADRTVGRGFVSGVDMPESPLMRLTDNHIARLRYLVGLLDFLFELFEAERPDFVFAPGVAGALAMALSKVSEHFGAQFRCLLWTRIGSRHTITDSPVGLSRRIEKRFETACEDSSAVENSLDEAYGIIESFRSQPATLRDAAFGWKRALRPLAPIDMAALAWRTVTRRPPELVNLPYPDSYLFWEIKRRARAFVLSHSRVFSPASALEGKRFAYFPLHRTPEASTMVLSPLLTDQVAVIEALSKCLPMETWLVVKEHVPMLGRRPMAFYERLSAIPKVVLLSPFADSFELIRRADITCVITGTAGWEGMLMKRPVLCLGRALYQLVGAGFVRCDELSRLPDAITEARSVESAPDERIAAYVAAVLAESFDLPKKLRYGVGAETVAAHPEISEAMVQYLLRSLESDDEWHTIRKRESYTA